MTQREYDDAIADIDRDYEIWLRAQKRKAFKATWLYQAVLFMLGFAIGLGIGLGS